VQPDNFLDATLIVLGHGTELNAGSAIPVNQHVAELRRRHLFAGVQPAFWKQEPQVKAVLAGVATPRVFIVPLFISEGYFSSDVIPRGLGFDYPDRLELVQDNSTLFYCRPVGSHESMTKVILARAASVVAQFPFPRAPKPSEITLFVAGHGTERNPESRKSVERQVEIIRELHQYAAVHAVFMEEAPRIGECYELSVTKNVVVVPFFISDGLHAVEDIPVLLGEAPALVKERVTAGQAAWRNPTGIKGKLVWYATAVGTEPLMADVILERVREAAVRQSPK
jgi:sirohydrochlorin cobaltochelatase